MSAEITGNYKRDLGKKSDCIKKGAAGVEPATSRSAVECSATELYPQLTNVQKISFKNKTSLNVWQPDWHLILGSKLRLEISAKDKAIITILVWKI